VKGAASIAGSPLGVTESFFDNAVSFDAPRLCRSGVNGKKRKTD
jgi:hypothetical protein